MLQVTEAWRNAHLQANVGLLVVSNVLNPASSEILDHHKRACETAIRAKFQSREAIAANAQIEAYRNYYKAFDKTYHVALQLESIALKNKNIPSVAGLVEAMFMAELRNIMLTAGHDYAALKAPLTLDVASGNERYMLINGKEQMTKPGDMIIADQEGVISSIIYGPDSRTRIVPDTQTAAFMTYAPNGISTELVQNHLSDIYAYIKLFSPNAKIELQKVFH